MRYAIALVAVLFSVQVLSLPALAQERKIAVISLSKAFDSYSKTKAVDEDLAKKAEKAKKETEKLAEKINKARDEAQLLSKEAKDAKAEEINKMMRELQDYEREAGVELRRQRDDMVKDIFKEMNDAITKYGKEKGFDIIFDDRVLLYANDSVDITADIINILNSKK